MLEPPSELLGDWGGSVWLLDAFCGFWRDVAALSGPNSRPERSSRSHAGDWVIRRRGQQGGGRTGGGVPNTQIPTST